MSDRQDNPSDRKQAVRGAAGASAPDSGDCVGVQSVLFDYMSSELDSGRSELVRTHLSECAGCRSVVAELQATLDVLNCASSSEASGFGLAEESRERIFWEVSHPVRAWMRRRGLLIGLVVLLLIVIVANSERWWRCGGTAAGGCAAGCVEAGMGDGVHR